jgi:hypothetical protein
MRVCPGCSGPVAEGSRYCPACGLSLSVDGLDPKAAMSDRTADASDSHPSDPQRRARFIPGKVLAGRYRVVERVGQGGMGEVYRAEDLKLGQQVALKFLPAGLDQDHEKRERFFSEVRLARQISHPNVSRVYDIGDVDGAPFLSMEFVDGEDLLSLLRRIGRLPADKANEIAREICTGLAAIHERGVLHRDLKPANVMLDGRGHARITDFGLAELQGGAVVDEEMIVGTPAYMSPEVLEGRPADTKSDLYSLGLVLYELFTGKRVWEASSIDELIRIRRTHTPPSPSSYVRDIDPAVERVIQRCLEKDPRRRLPSAVAAAAALPGGDPLAAAIAAGETPSPELVAAARDELQGMRPAIAWISLGAFGLGLAVLLGLSSHTRIVPAAPLEEPPSVMAVRARDLLQRFGSGAKAVDRAQGFFYEERYVDWIATSDSSAGRWSRLTRPRPPVVTYWYRESPRELIPVARDARVDYADPPRLVPGMAGVQLDGLGRLRRLDVVPLADAAPRDTGAVDWMSLFRMAGLDTAAFHAIAPSTPPVGIADRFAAWEGIPADGQGVPVHVEAASFLGRPVFFALREPWSQIEGPGDSVRDPSGRITAIMIAIVRPLLFVIALVVGAWLARRNLRAGRGDRPRATRVAAVLLGLRILIWVIGAHHTPQSVTLQLANTVALGLYDFAFGWVFYIAVEPYFRRLWPRVLTSWVRLLDGRFDDPQVGRDLLVGCVVGVAIGLAVAAHQAAPMLLGAAPGRPDNVGFVEHQLTTIVGFLHQMADALTVQRSALILAMEFVVILVVARLILRKAVAAIVVTFLLFIPFALPKGEWVFLNIGFAACSLALVFFVMLRFGLLAAIVALLVNSTLQSTPLEWNPSSWSQSATLVTLSIVVGVALYGFVRSLAGRAAIRDVFLER